jgi:8-oxo-dGTP pyrophosphatase MutT (NUDIX family)
LKSCRKFPGGAANLAEDISSTAVREVFEETGIRSKFCSVIGFRQQHNYPTAHGRSDLYIVTRLEPLSFDINKCNDEIKDCQWIDLDHMCTLTGNNLTTLISKLIRHGKENGFDSIDIKPNYMESIFPGRFYNFFHRNCDFK